MTTGWFVAALLHRHRGRRPSDDRQPRRAGSTFLIAGAVAAFALAGCAADESLAVQAEPGMKMAADRPEDRPPEPPPHHDVAPRLDAAAQSRLGDRYGGFWVDGIVMVVAVVGGPTDEDVAALEPVAEGLPHEFVAVDTSYARLQEVVDDVFSGPLGDRIGIIAADQDDNAVYIGVSTAGAAVEEVRGEVTRRYPDVKFVVEFAQAPQTVDG